MAGSKVNYLEAKILDLVLGAQSWTPPGTLYLCLSTAAYSDAATGSSFSEVVGNGYGRVAIVNNLTNWPAAVVGALTTKSNAGVITFPTATGTGFGNCVSWYLADAISAGNLLYGADLTSPRTVAAGDTASFAASALIVRED